MPGDKAEDNGIKTVKKIGGFVAGLIGNEDQKSAVEKAHIKTARNWTRAANGMLQGAILAIALIALTNLGVLFALSAGALLTLPGYRHIHAAGYTEAESRGINRELRLFWQ